MKRIEVDMRRMVFVSAMILLLAGCHSKTEPERISAQMALGIESEAGTINLKDYLK